jgi:hypothetical protein
MASCGRQHVQQMPECLADQLKQGSGQEWIRTTEGVKPADLQSAPFGHFGTYPERSFALTVARSRFIVGERSDDAVITRSSVYRTPNQGVQADFGVGPARIVAVSGKRKKNQIVEFNGFSIETKYALRSSASVE